MLKTHAPYSSEEMHEIASLILRHLAILFVVLLADNFCTSLVWSVAIHNRLQKVALPSEY